MQRLVIGKREPYVSRRIEDRRVSGHLGSLSSILGDEVFGNDRILLPFDGHFLDIRHRVGFAHLLEGPAKLFPESRW